MEYVNAIISNWAEIVTQGFLAIGGLVAFLTALYAIALIIPGDQPDKVIEKALNFTKRFSRK